MPPRAPSQVRVETLIARGRLVLAVFLLLALRVATPRGSESAFGVALAFLGYAGALGLLVRTRFGDGPKWPGATHAIDLSVYAICLFLLGGLAPSMLAWFLFLLVAATLRWGWRGTLTTGSVAVALHVAIGAQVAETLPNARLAPTEFITLALLMGVMTVFVGLVGAYEDWRGGQLARLAAWAGPDPDRPLVLPSEMLAQTAVVLEAPRTLLVWEEAEEPFTEFALWSDGRVERFREAPGTFGDVVDVRVRDSGFFCRDLAARLPVTFLRSAKGLVSWRGCPSISAFASGLRFGRWRAGRCAAKSFEGGSSASTSPGSPFRTSPWATSSPISRPPACRRHTW
jgi:hypothetical protein